MNKYQQMSAMNDSSDTATIPGLVVLDSGVVPCFKVESGTLAPTKKVSTPPGRLTSLRTRDLTLSGAFKKSKKTFEPNVHALRKSKDELKEEVIVSKKEKTERDERKRETRSRRKRERPQTIQSHSIFEQGPADSLHKIGWRGIPHVQDSSIIPVDNLVKKETREDQDEIISKLQRDDFIDDPGLMNDERLKPIQLPLGHLSSLKTTMTSGTEKPCQSYGTLSKTEPPKPVQPSLNKMLQDLKLSDKQELFFMQLPDCMPASGSAHSSNSSTLADRRKVHLHGQVAKKDGSPVLSQFPEGFLGKLQIRKSGKVELRLGDIVMDVSEGAAFSFLQQLVSVHLSDGWKGDMMT
ncbi:DNA-directed RNA polymerase III subunit RPC4 isoform X3 [Takifugu rubripes]|uniref:DNA-directed RNA polymerase III subunit RPC4 isoform X3 n=1 Tax=Takifugu rubripes TaxID=31033 RepID=UPI0011456FEB|nr:DNA-directed RNA polymerase III subunit RPC4-like isoform X3 [Takifugu rubripes]